MKRIAKVLIPLILATLAGVGHSQNVDTWTGGSATEANFSDAANWTFSNGATAVGNGDYLSFGAAGGSGATLTDDLANSSFSGITFTSGGSAYTFGGNPFALTGGITNNAGAQVINNNLTLSNNVSVIDVAGNVTFNGSIGDNGSGYGLAFPGAAGGKTIIVTGTNTYSGNTIFGGNFGGVNNGNAFDFTGTGSATNSVFYQGVEGSGDATYFVDNPSTSGTNLRTAGFVYNSVSLGGNNYLNFTINGTSAGPAVESFGALTLGSGSLEGTINTASAGNNVQVWFNGVTRNPGSIFYFGRINGNTSTLGLQPIATASGNSANIVFTNPPLLVASVGGTTVLTNSMAAEALFGTPQAPVLPWANVSQTISTYDTNYGLRALQSAEQVTLANGLPPGENARITSGSLTLTGNLQVNSLYGGSDTITLAGYTLTVGSGAIEGNVSLVIGGSVNDGYLALGSEGVLYVDNTRHTTINSVITGTQGLTVHFNDLNNNTAYAVLAATNTFSGVTRVAGNNTAMALELANSLALQNSTLDYNNYGATIKFVSPATAAQTFGGLEGSQNLSIAGVALTVGGDGDSTTYGGLLSGAAGSLIKIGTGTLTLSNLNTYTGGTTISNGQVNINNGGSSTASSAIGTGPLTLLGGAFDNTSGLAETLAPNNPQVWNGNFTFNGSAALNLGAGSVTLAGNSRITVAANTLTVGGVISGNNYSLTKTGSGTLLLTNASTYSGNSIIGGGKLALAGSAGIGSSPGIIVSNGATLDVSGLTSTFTLGGSQSLAASGTVIGPITTTSGSEIYADSGAAYGTNTFSGNLTLVAGAGASFQLGTTASGPNDLILVGGNLALAGNVISLSAPGTTVNLGTSDYTLFTVSGTITGTLASSPVWVVKPLNYGNYSIVTSGNTVKLHYQAAVNPAISAIASPASVSRGQSTVLTATVTPGTYAISSVSVNASPIGGASAVALIQSTPSNVYTNTLVVGTGAPAGGTPLTATVTDSQGNTGSTNIALTVLPGSVTWSGGSTTDNNWSDPANWAGGVAPAGGDVVTFAGSTRPNPVMNQSYALSAVIFASGAGNFVITNTAGSVLTLSGSGVVNNSASAQSLNVPVVLNTAQTINAAAGNLTLGGTVSGPASLNVTGTNQLTLAGANAYASGTTVSAGTLVVANNSALGSGPLTLAGGSISNSAGTSYTVANNVILSSPATAGVGAGDTFTLAGTISGGGTLTESGNGALALASANSYGGGTIVNSGTLVIGSSRAVGSGLLTVSGFGSISNSAGVNRSLGNVISLTGLAGIEVGPADTLDLTAAITNAGGLYITGGGTLGIVGSQANTYGGGTVVNAGTSLDVENSSSAPLGTNTLTFAGGTLEDLSAAVSATIPNNIMAVTNTTSYLNPTAFDGVGLTLSGNISGPGNITVNGGATSYDAFVLSGNNRGFSGTLTVQGGNYQRFEFGSAASGSSNAMFVLNNTVGTDTAKTTFGPGTFAMGALSGPGLLRNDGAGLTILSIGGLNTNANWAGVLQQGGSANLFSVVKVGTGVQVFSGDNTYTSSNEVAGGTFELTSAQQTGQNLQVDDGATLGVWDTGTGSAMVGDLALGTNAGGGLLLTNLYASGGAPLSSSGTVTVNGTCVVTLTDTANLSPGGIYTLISYSTLAGAGNFVLSPLPGGVVGGLINDPAYGGLFLSLPQTTTPTNLTVTASSAGGVITLGLTWPADHQGWALQTNSVGLNVNSAWGVVPGSEFSTSQSFTVDPTQTNVFFRLALP